MNFEIQQAREPSKGYDGRILWSGNLLVEK
jgi:hypothetical protein